MTLKRKTRDDINVDIYIFLIQRTNHALINTGEKWSCLNMILAKCGVPETKKNIWTWSVFKFLTNHVYLDSMFGFCIETKWKSTGIRSKEQYTSEQIKPVVYFPLGKSKKHFPNHDHDHGKCGSAHHCTICVDLSIVAPVWRPQGEQEYEQR